MGYTLVLAGTDHLAPNPGLSSRPVEKAIVPMVSRPRNHTKVNREGKGSQECAGIVQEKAEGRRRWYKIHLALVPSDGAQLAQVPSAYLGLGDHRTESLLRVSRYAALALLDCFHC